MTKKKKELVNNDQVQGDMTPMIDIIFQLLIFFMCSMKFKEIEGRLLTWLPTGKGPNPTEVKPKLYDDIMIYIDYDVKKGEATYQLNSEKFGKDKDKMIKKVVAVYNIAKMAVLNDTNIIDKEVPIIVNPSVKAPMQSITDVLSMLKKEKIEKVEFPMKGAPLKVN